ncbi:MAG: acyltransferase family protein [Myxococcus sp.]|nr:acyltransferase family protein [Myxococcus sp.]
MSVPSPPPTLATPSPSHRADIDGLRGVAVVLVVLFHAWPTLVPGGFVGVDVFFVISGFVVTQMVRRDLARQPFRALDFYLRRVNRLAPALLAMLAATLTFSVLLLSPTLLTLVLSHAAAGLAMMANLLFAAQASYFDVSAEVKPLLHLWSLAVEEQFYLAVPLAVAMARRAPRVAGALAVGLTLGSLAASVALTGVAPQWAFFLPVTRAWELLAGVLLAQRPAASGPHRGRLRAALASLGLALIAGAAFGLDRTTPFPGVAALLPVGGAALVLWGGPGQGVAKLLSRGWLVWLGLISYPLYLWHWPLLTLGRLSVPLEQDVVITPLAVGAAVLLAWLTFAFLERPARARQSRAVALGLVGAAALLAVTLTGLQLSGAPQRWSARGAAALELADFERAYDFKTDARFGTCWLVDEVAPSAGDCVEEAPAGLPLVMVWGDSHAARFTAGLRAVQAERHAFRLAQRTRSSCPPLLDAGNASCRDANQAVVLEAAALRPAVLILDARWTNAPQVSALRATLEQLRRALPSTRLVVVGPVPEWRVTLPWTLNARVGVAPVPERLRPERYDRQRQAEAQLQATAREGGATFVSALDGLCRPDEGCLVRLSEAPLMLTTWDYGHLTTPAAKLVARRVALAW